MAATSAQRICKVPGCDEPLSGRSKLDECPACRARLVAWLKRSPAEIYNYRVQLRRRDGRMSQLMPGDVDKLAGNAQEVRQPGNYKPISKRGKRIANRTPVTRTKRAGIEHRAAH